MLVKGDQEPEGGLLAQVDLLGKPCPLLEPWLSQPTRAEGVPAASIYFTVCLERMLGFHRDALGVPWLVVFAGTSVLLGLWQRAEF